MKPLDKYITSKENLLKFLDDKNFKKILIITGNNSYKKSGAEKLFQKIVVKNQINFYFKKSFLPNIHELKRIYLYYKKINPDLIIAIGGGAVLDYAKIVNILDDLTNIEKKIKKYSYPIKKKNCKLIAIPTTAGSGAEVTSNAVIYINNVKYSFEHKLLIPDYFFLIPEFVMKVPKKIKSSSGFDAIAQAMESIISLKSSNQSVLFATDSLKLSLKYFPNYLKSPTINNCKYMSIASNLAGKAINISKTTAPHAVSYPFSSIYNISHGHAVSLTFNKFLKFNFINEKSSISSFDLKKRYSIFFKIFKVKNINDLIFKIDLLKKDAKLENDYEKLGIDLDGNIDKFLNNINLLRLKNNPIQLNKNDIKKIIL